MSLRQMLAAWIAGKPNDPIARAKKKPAHLTSKQKEAKEKQAYKQIVKYRIAKGYPVPTEEEYAAYLRGDAPLASGRMKRAPSWKVQA